MEFEKEYLNLINEWYNNSLHEYPIQKIINAVKEITKNGTLPWVKHETGLKIQWLVTQPSNDTNNPEISDDELNKLAKYWKDFEKLSPSAFNVRVATNVLHGIRHNVSAADVGIVAYGIYEALKDNYTLSSNKKQGPVPYNKYSMREVISDLKVTIDKIYLSWTGDNAAYVFIGKDSNGIKLYLRLSYKEKLGKQIFDKFWPRDRKNIYAFITEPVDLPKPFEATVIYGVVTDISELYKSVTIQRTILSPQAKTNFEQSIK